MGGERFLVVLTRRLLVLMVADCLGRSDSRGWEGLGDTRMEEKEIEES